MQEFDKNGFIEEDMEDDGIITLLSADGEEIDFLEIAGVALNGSFYAIVQPVELLEGMAEDEALVFRVDIDENENETYTIELDDDIINAVFEQYNAMYDAANLGEEE